MSPKQKHRRFAPSGTRLSVVVSVALVLFLIGLIALVALGSQHLVNSVRGSMGFTVVLTDSLSVEQTERMNSFLLNQPYTGHTTLLSADEVLDRWQRLAQDTTDLVLLDGVNPFTAEVNVITRPEYASRDSLTIIASRIQALPEVDSVIMSPEIADALNLAISRITMVLGAIALVLLVISIILINNTIRLAVHSHRFQINTMKLVGATPGFIRRPYIVANLVNGLIAGIIASACLAALLFYGADVEHALRTLIDLPLLAVLFGAITLLGIILCSGCALFAANRYLRSDRDQLYRY